MPSTCPTIARSICPVDENPDVLRPGVAGMLRVYCCTTTATHDMTSTPSPLCALRMNRLSCFTCMPFSKVNSWTFIPSSPSPRTLMFEPPSGSLAGSAAPIGQEWSQTTSGGCSACPSRSPHTRFLVGCGSSFMRLAEQHLTFLFALGASKQCLPGR